MRRREIDNASCRTALSQSRAILDKARGVYMSINGISPNWLSVVCWSIVLSWMKLVWVILFVV